MAEAIERMTAEDKELLFIWQRFHRGIRRSKFRYLKYRHYKSAILDFWKLKSKIDDYKKQIILFDNQYKELLEEINEDLALVENDLEDFCSSLYYKIQEKYEKKLWSQKK